MNLDALKRKTIKDAIRAGAIAGGALVLYMGVSGWHSSVQQEQTQLQAQFGQAQSEIALLRTKVDSAGTTGKSFQELVAKRGGAAFEIDNARVRDVLQELVERHRLNLEGKLEYSAQQPYDIPALQNLTNKFIVRREARFTFSAITDQHVYSFLEELRRELPGIIRFTKLALKRTAEPEPGVIANLSSGTPVYMVSAEVVFDWYGITEAKELAKPQGGQL